MPSSLADAQRLVDQADELARRRRAERDALMLKASQAGSSLREIAAAIGASPAAVGKRLRLLAATAATEEPSTGPATPTQPVEVVDVVHAAWLGHGSPAQGGDLAEGVCARCGRTDQLQPVRTALTKKFASFDGWACRDGGICAACRWAYSTVPLRRRALLVTRAPASAEELSLARLREVLGVAVGPDRAVTVPLHPERNKHLLPAAQWGRVVADEAVVAWTGDDAVLLEVVAGLRARGCPVSRLGEAAPPWRWLRTLSGAERLEAMGSWGRLDPWRRGGPWLELAILATATAGGGRSGAASGVEEDGDHGSA